MWAGIWGLLAVLPDLVKLGKLIYAGIESGVDYIDVRIHIKKMKTATDQARATKDTSKIEELFRGKNPSPTPAD